MFKWLQRSKGPVQPARPKAATSFDGGIIISTPQELEQYLRHGNESLSGESIGANEALATPVVYRCVDIISSSIASMPVEVKKTENGRNVDAVDHPLWSLLKRKPNMWQKPGQFKEYLMTCLLLRGNAYILKVYSRDKLVGLIPVSPDAVSTKQMPDMSLQYTYTNKNGVRSVFTQKDILHITGLSLDGICGVSVIAYAKDSIGLARATERHGGAFFKNGTNVGSVLSHPGALGEEGQAALRQSLEAYRGSDNANKALILEEGMEYKPLGMTSADAQFIETKQFTRSDIAMFFGVPPHMYGDTTKATSYGTGIEQQSAGFVRYTLQAWMNRIEEAINCDLVGEDEIDIYAELNPSVLLRGDSKARSEYYTAARNSGYMTINEIREKEGLNPIEGGDEPFKPLNSNLRETNEQDAT